MKRKLFSSKDRRLKDSRCSFLLHPYLCSAYLKAQSIHISSNHLVRRSDKMWGAKCIGVLRKPLMENQHVGKTKSAKVKGWPKGKRGKHEKYNGHYVPKLGNYSFTLVTNPNALDTPNFTILEILFASFSMLRIDFIFYWAYTESSLGKTPEIDLRASCQGKLH